MFVICTRVVQTSVFLIVLHKISSVNCYKSQHAECHIKFYIMLRELFSVFNENKDMYVLKSSVVSNIDN